jgi:hypothetical protein
MTLGRSPTQPDVFRSTAAYCEGRVPDDSWCRDTTEPCALLVPGRTRLRDRVRAFVRDDLPIITREVLDEGRLASTSADIRFSYGAESVPLFRDISVHLSAVKGTVADRIEGVGHAIYDHPASAAAYIQVSRV